MEGLYRRFSYMFLHVSRGWEVCETCWYGDKSMGFHVKHDFEENWKKKCKKDVFFLQKLVVSAVFSNFYLDFLSDKTSDRYNLYMAG